MRHWIAALSVLVLTACCAQAQQARLAIKSGESVELGPIYWVMQCRSVLVGLPEIEILEGPEQISLSIKAGPVLPRRQGCAKPVSGGTLIMTAKPIAAQTEAKLTYRIKYKLKDGQRQTSKTYVLSLFP
jgi:hypothetical protein